jgi:copper(I)-binding protein
MDGIDPTPAPAGRDARVDRRRPRWPAAAAVAALCLSPAVAGCGTGPPAPISDHVGNASGAVARVGEMAVLEVEFLFDRPVAGDEVYDVGGIAPLAVTLVNTGDAPDRLVRVSSPIAEAGLVVVDGGLVIPGHQTLTAGQIGPVASIEVPYEDDTGLIALIGLEQPIRSGVSYPVVFGFERAGDVTIDVPVKTPDFPPPRAGEGG